MRQILPTPEDDVEPYDVYRPDDPRAPLLRVDMVASADGAATDRRGRSGGLGTAGDREVFRSLRALADAIMVGAGTVRAEGYGPHRLRADLAARRRADGRPAPAPIVVVTASLDLDLSAPLFTEAKTATIVLTCASAPPDRLRAARGAGLVVVAGDRRVDLAAGVAALRSEFGLAHLLCEGGPRLNAPLLSSGLVDELCLTIAPRLVGGPGPRILADLGAPLDLRLRGLCEQDGELYARYGVEWPSSEQP